MAVNIVDNFVEEPAVDPSKLEPPRVGAGAAMAGQESNKLESIANISIGTSDAVAHHLFESGLARSALEPPLSARAESCYGVSVATSEAYSAAEADLATDMLAELAAR